MGRDTPLVYTRDSYDCKNSCLFILDPRDWRRGLASAGKRDLIGSTTSLEALNADCIESDVRSPRRKADDQAPGALRRDAGLRAGLGIPHGSRLAQGGRLGHVVQ